MKTILLALCFCVAVSTGVLLKRKPFHRLIPRDKLRDFPQTCFASTQCKVFKAGESWSLAPFCGFSTCKELNATDSEGVPLLAEQVTDCGPLVDITRSPGCTLVPITDEDKKKEFPDCCPQFDCEEGTEIFYEGSQPAPAAAAEGDEPRSLN